MLTLLALLACTEEVIDTADESLDEDNDGFTVYEDCHDRNPEVFPGAVETCNGVDDDCNGLVDDGVGEATLYRDADGDGVGGEEAQVCPGAGGYVETGGDCDDSDAGVYPGAPERCDGLDEDCDDQVDESPIDGVSGYADADGDGFGDGELIEACEGDLVAAEGDCDDGDAQVNPDAEEVCGDGIDNDCDTLGCARSGSVDESEAWFAVRGQAGDEAGGPARIVGDIDGDGSPELAVSARYADEGGENAGTIYIFSTPLTPREALVTDATTWLIGEAASDNAYAVWGLGDIDGDGTDDLAVSARLNDSGANNAGRTYVVMGPVQGKRSLADADATFDGVSAGDQTGVLTRPGDLSGDGVPDLLVTSPKADSKTGAAWLAFGPFSGAASLAQAEVQVQGSAAGDQLGGGLSSAGDVDGDGQEDMLLAAPTTAEGGAVYLFLGPLDAGTLSAADADQILVAEAPGDDLGFGMSRAGDHDGDGLDDVLVSAGNHDKTANNAGAAYLLRGPLDGGLADAAARFDGPEQGSRLSPNDGGGDLDLDGNPDIALGSRYTDVGGAAWVFYGPVSGSYLATDADFEVRSTESGATLGSPVQIAPDLDRDGDGELLVGARKADGGAGALYLFEGTAL